MKHESYFIVQIAVFKIFHLPDIDTLITTACAFTLHLSPLEKMLFYQIQRALLK